MIDRRAQLSLILFLVSCKDKRNSMWLSLPLSNLWGLHILSLPLIFFFFLTGEGGGREVGVLATFRFKQSWGSRILLLHTTFFQVHSVTGNDSQQQSITQSCSAGKEHCNLVLTLCKFNYQQQFIYASNFQQEAPLPNRGWKQSVRMHLRQRQLAV